MNPSIIPDNQLSNNLLTFFGAVSSVRNKERLHELLSNELKKLISINGIMIFAFDAGRNSLYPYLVHFDEGKEPGETRLRVSLNGDGLMDEIIAAVETRTWTLSQLMKMSDRPDYVTRYRINNIKKMAAASLISETDTIGTVLLFSENSEAFGIKELAIINMIIPQIAVAVKNSSFHTYLINENREQQQIISWMSSLHAVKTWAEFEQVLTRQFGLMTFFEEAYLLLSRSGQQRGVQIKLKQSSKKTGSKNRNKPAGEFDVEDDFMRLVKNMHRANVFQLNELINLGIVPDYVRSWENDQVAAVLTVPIFDREFFLGTVVLLSAEGGEPLFEHLNLMRLITEQITLTCATISQSENVAHQLNELNRSKNQLKIEKSYLQEELQTAHNYSEIVGTSNSMKQVFHLVSQVSPTNSSTLILGETGTGKELIARAIHNGSSRKDKVMIKVNCATLPANLIESELFGHERGSFTGAMERRIGKFELANNSTIFLDEIGEMPIGLQVKLLRALQEKEIERVGGKVPIKIDVRVIAATNRDLYKEVQAGNFRSDLYFRLNVFPIMIPALRERKEDIPLLVSHFVSKYASKLTLAKIHFTSRAIKQLTAYNWPGNVRELEHLVERSILMAKGKLITEVYLPLADGDDRNTPLQNKDVKTIDQVEREHIITVLRMVNGKVSGVGGAAEILKIPSTTLSSKIRRLKIKKEVF